MSQEETKAGEADKKDDKPYVNTIFQIIYSDVGTMRKGDYMIHVFVEKVRQIKVPEGGTVDPIVQIDCMNEKKFTTAKDDIGSTGVCLWNEHIFFEPRNVSVTQIESAKISIRLNDKHLFKDALIGMYEFDVAYVYFMKQHLMLHKWIALSNPAAANFNEVTAYMKLSISVACTGDEQVQITDDTGPEDDSVMMPPSIRPEYYQLSFRFFKGEKLPIMDAALFGKGGSIDAYVLCKYMTQKLKTKTVTMKNEEVYWYQEFQIPVQMPIMTSRLVMQLFDEDRLKDEIVGSMFFNLKEYIDEKATEPTSRFFWKNIYGSPLGCSGNNTNLMNTNPELASTWKGRILMEVKAEKTEKPLIQKEDFGEEIQEAGEPYLQMKEYEIIAEVGQGIALPDAKQYTVKIKIADFELKTDKPKFFEHTYNRWNQRFPVTSYNVAYQDIMDMGKVYLYLMDGEKPVCYAKDDIRNWMDPNPKMKWFEMTPDLAIGKVKENHKAGLISVKLSIHDKTANGPIDFKNFTAWKKAPPKRPQVFKVRCYVFQCRDLPAADSNGSSDPYIIFWDTQKKPTQTKVIEDNVNPLYYETIELMIEANSQDTMPPFVLDIYDKDFNPLDPDDFICRSIIYPEDAHFSEDNEVKKPKWHPCTLKAGAPMCGEVLISFSIVVDDYFFKTPLDHMNIMEYVEFDEDNVEISILGLRGLQSVGILPVKKAFIQFALKSLVPPQCAQAIENIKTQPGPAGPDPTINTVMKFSIPLPNDPLYCPRLQCSVYDNIFKSFMQPLLGVFTIPIGELKFAQIKQKQDELDGLDHIINELDLIIQDQGIVSYNIQEQKLEIDLDISFRSERSKQKSIIEDAVKNSTNKSFSSYKSNKLEVKEVKAALFAPLLNNLSDDSQQSISNISYQEDTGRRSMISEGRRSARKSVAQYIEEKKETTKGNDKSFKEQFDDFDKKSQKSYKSNKSGKSIKTNASRTSGKNEKKNKALDASIALFNKYTDVNKSAELKRIRDEDERSRREEDTIREIDIEEMKRQGDNPYKTIVKPQYELDPLLQVYREIDPPPDSLYIGLGFDDVPEDNRKHYRRYYPDELENITELLPNPSPFLAYYLKRGQTRGASKGFFSFSSAKEDDSGEVSTEQVVGKFKCLIDVEGAKAKELYLQKKDQKLHDLKVKLNQLSMKIKKKALDFNLERITSMEGKFKFMLQMDRLGLAHLNIPKFLCDMETTNTLKRLLLGKNRNIVRVYMISAYDLASRDNDSPSDPYLVVKLGDKNYNERDNYIEDDPDPDFHKYYDFEAVFPGCPMLNIQVYDYDALFGDDLIGETNIDLEDRFFSPEWQSITDKPIEYRQIYHPSSSISQGVVKCWVEIIAANNLDVPVWNIAPRPPETFEVRVCIFDTLDIKMMDAEGTSDAYIRGFFDSKEENKETDTHFRCNDGKASFNYRFIFRVTKSQERKNYDLNIQAYDRDLFSSNDIIGEGRIPLKQAFEDCQLTKRPISVSKQYYEKCMIKSGAKIEFKDDSNIWVQLSSMNEKGVLEQTGKVRIQIDIMPVDYAEQNKVGEARNEPNMNPFLPPPVGRISFSLNPFKMLSQLVGPAVLRKIYCYCCLALCLALCIMMAPMIAGQMVSSLIMLPFS